MPKQLLYSLLICIFSQHVAAQNADDTTLHENALNAISVYYEKLGQESPLYNGSEYLEYAYTLQEGHPFFQLAGRTDQSASRAGNAVDVQAFRLRQGLCLDHGAPPLKDHCRCHPLQSHRQEMEVGRAWV